MRYLNPQLSYYYFRFRKTNRRHIEIYFLFAIWPQISLLYAAFYNTTNFIDVWRFTPKLLPFIENPTWRRVPSWICNTVLLDHPQSALVVRRSLSEEASSESTPCGQSACQIWRFQLQPFPRYIRSPEILKVGHVILYDPLWPNFAYFFLNISHVNPSRPLLPNFAFFR